MTVKTNIFRAFRQRVRVKIYMLKCIGPVIILSASWLERACVERSSKTEPALFSC